VLLRCDSEEYSPFYPYRPLGIARISFGAASTVDDVLAFIDFLKKSFVRGRDGSAARREGEIRGSECSRGQ